MANRSCIIRLSRYKNALLKLKSLGFVRIFSENLADATSVSAAQVRKDFSMFGIRGNRRGGYQVDQLVKQLNEILGKDRIHSFVLVGAGNLGKALLRYKGFEKNGIKVVAGFDIDPAEVNRDTETPVLPLEELEGYVKENKIELGIITVPDYAAQQISQFMVQAGIKGILNFAPMRLKVPEDCVISNMNLETELENIIYFVNTANKGEKTE